MALVCPVGFDKQRLQSEVRDTSSKVAQNPGGDFHFHRGPDYAARLLGYDFAERQSLPEMLPGHQQGKRRAQVPR